MSDKVDALFAGEPPKAPAAAGRRIRNLYLLLGIAIPLDLLGPFLWTGVPGAFLTLWAWLAADQETESVEAGRYSAEDGLALLRIRSVAQWALAFCIVSLALQAWLLSTDFYEQIWGLLAELLS